MKLFCFGLGYSARLLVQHLAAQGWQIAGTTRSAAGRAHLADAGIDAMVFDGSSWSREIAETLAQATHVLVSVPPGGDGDPVLSIHANDIVAAKPRWIGYFSTVGVYGDLGGAWCNEDTPLKPATPRGARRVAAEQCWTALADQAGCPLAIFRLAGIYGPGRNQLEGLIAGTARRIVKSGQVFNRIHVEDIAGVVEASINRPPSVMRAYNVSDDEPAPPQDVVAYAAGLLGLAPPPEIPFEQADLSEMAKSFYDDNKRCSNARIKTELGVSLIYPTYREGLAALLDEPKS